MSLGKRKTGIDSFMPTAKFDAKVGAFYLQTRVLGSNGWQTEQRDVTDVLRERGAIFDLENGQRGWIRFVKGQAPDMVLVPFGADSDPGEAPSPDHKEGVRLIVKLAGDEPREFLSTALAVWGAIDSVHTAFEKQRRDHPGEVPVLKCTDVIESKLSNGASYIPVLVIDRFVPRPPDLPAGGSEERKATKPVRTGAVKRGDLADEIPF
jgi:hypothetical protein